MLIADQISYRLPDGRPLFRDVSLHVAAGEAIAITGPSGVGKTTLLSILGGVQAADHGRVVARAVDPHSSTSWVLQTLNALGGRSVLENACLTAYLDGEDRRDIRTRALEALEMLDICHLRSKKARDLSGGEQQRLAVARALVASRPIVLADEPTSQLDYANSEIVMRALVNLAHKRRAVVIVTHDTSALPDNCRVLSLREDGLHAA